MDKPYIPLFGKQNRQNMVSKTKSKKTVNRPTRLLEKAKKFIPVWVGRIEKSGGLIQAISTYRDEYNNASCCLVGEFHNFNCNYGCIKCYDMSTVLSYIGHDLGINYSHEPEAARDAWLKAFLDHIKNDHCNKKPEVK